jgi:hypothetical protein
MWHAELMADHGKQQSSVGMVAQGAGPAIATRTEQLPPGPSPKETLDGTGRDRTAMRIADVVFAVAVAATFVLYFVKSRGVVLNGDDWATVPRGNTFIDYFKPYQQNLSIVPIAVYHFVFTVFGFGTYWPLRFAGIASHMAIVVTVFMIVRSRWGSAVALVVGVALLWYPIALLTPALFNHWLALTGCLVAGWALTLPPGRSDWIAAIALTFALCSSGVGVAGAAGCLAYVALSKAPLRRWLAVGVPVALFVLWWFTLASDDHGQNAHRSLVDHARYLFDGVTYSFQFFAPGGRWLGIPLAIVFVACIAWQLRAGVRAAAQALAWTFAIVVWWGGLAITRAGAHTGEPDSFRYRVVTCGFAALALLPLAKSLRARQLLTSRRALAIALVACAALIAINAPGIFHRVETDAADYRQQAAKMVVLNLGPSVVPDDVVVHFDLFVTMTARRYRALVDKYGEVAGTSPAHPDAELVNLAGIRPVPVSDGAGTCVPLQGPTDAPRRIDIRRGANAATRVLLRAPSTEVTVQLRRFEQSWVTVGRIPAGTTAALDLPILMARTPWTLQAAGACAVQP